jgi:hypothetical protein
MEGSINYFFGPCPSPQICPELAVSHRRAPGLNGVQTNSVEGWVGLG